MVAGGGQGGTGQSGDVLGQLAFEVGGQSGGRLTGDRPARQQRGRRVTDAGRELVDEHSHGVVRPLEVAAGGPVAGRGRGERAPEHRDARAVHPVLHVQAPGRRLPEGEGGGSDPGTLGALLRPGHALGGEQHRCVVERGIGRGGVGRRAPRLVQQLPPLPGEPHEPRERRGELGVGEGAVPAAAELGCDVVQGDLGLAQVVVGLVTPDRKSVV